MSFLKGFLTPDLPPEAAKLRGETHEAARQAKLKLAKLNTVMSNGITLKIYQAAGGKSGH